MEPPGRCGTPEEFKRRMHAVGASHKGQNERRIGSPKSLFTRGDRKLSAAASNPVNLDTKLGTAPLLFADIVHRPLVPHKKAGHILYRGTFDKPVCFGVSETCPREVSRSSRFTIFRPARICTPAARIT